MPPRSWRRNRAAKLSKRESWASDPVRPHNRSRSLSNSVTEAAQTAVQIVSSSQQQLVGLDQMALAMENIKEASGQNLASAKQLKTAAQSLQELGRKLKQTVDRCGV